MVLASPVAVSQTASANLHLDGDMCRTVGELIDTEQHVELVDQERGQTYILIRRSYQLPRSGPLRRLCICKEAEWNIGSPSRMGN